MRMKSARLLGVTFYIITKRMRNLCSLNVVFDEILLLEWGRKKIIIRSSARDSVLCYDTSYSCRFILNINEWYRFVRNREVDVSGLTISDGPDWRILDIWVYITCIAGYWVWKRLNGLLSFPGPHRPAIIQGDEGIIYKSWAAGGTH